jgi:hypothetical protein
MEAKINLMNQVTDLVSSEWVIDQNRTEWYRTTVVDRQTVVHAELDDMVQKDQ